MQWRRWGAISIGVLAVAALIAGARPARLRLARVTHVSTAPPLLASVSLLYTRGARPQFVILDITGAHGATGSATISGDQEFVETPLAGVPGGPYQIAATLAYRIGGFLTLRYASFAG
jgi:hypothetical protein